MPLDAITPETIEAWFDHLIINEKLKHTTINGYYKPFQTMIRWAVKKRILIADPTLNIQKLSDDRIVCLANKLAALTGMQASEVFDRDLSVLYGSELKRLNEAGN